VAVTEFVVEELSESSEGVEVLQLNPVVDVGLLAAVIVMLRAIRWSFVIADKGTFQPDGLMLTVGLDVSDAT
jgi:hypothetical protein